MSIKLTQKNIEHGGWKNDQNPFFGGAAFPKQLHVLEELLEFHHVLPYFFCRGCQSTTVMVNRLFWARWFGILGVHPSNNPFHNGIPGIQTTGPQTNN